MNIGLISDTHGYLDPKLATIFDGCDEIWHAGDIGPISVLESLERIKPVFAVHGNIDGQEVRTSCPRDLWLEREGIRVFLTHIAGRPGNYTKRVREILSTSIPDIMICGHSHILRVQKDPAYGDMLYINPGAAGRQGFHHKKTVVRFSIVKARITNLEVVDLGKRGSTDA